MGNKVKLTRAEKRQRREEKWNDPLGIDKMSDEEFLEQLPKLKKKATEEGIGGVVLFIICIILFAVFWDTIFH